MLPPQQVRLEDPCLLSLQDPTLLLAITVLGVTVLLLALKTMSSRKKDLITLEDPNAKYPLPLIEKEVMASLPPPLGGRSRGWGVLPCPWRLVDSQECLWPPVAPCCPCCGF